MILRYAICENLNSAIFEFGNLTLAETIIISFFSITNLFKRLARLTVELSYD